ncbi:MAG: M20/M25/M40 family metallo-hydrolase [Candidatus Latescibacteria bacterium]|nr:M20/M25/M40 family metallo-hydrolase [Candidatus Latescibacterota bacterium]
MPLDVVELSRELIAYNSVSQLSNVPVTRHVAQTLKSLGFEIEELPYTDANGVDKLSIVGKLGQGRGGLTLMSHDDVVPAANAQDWTGSPFAGRLANDRLYGRGAADMKGPLAASICAAARFAGKDLKAPVFIVVTADEEITAAGAFDVTRRSRLFQQASSGYGLICEPTRLKVVYAHKGGLSIRVESRGRAAHTSTLKGINANLKMIPFLAEMKKINELALTAKRYRNDQFKPAHSEWSIGINDHNEAMNISPVQSVCLISYRLMPGVDVSPLIERTKKSARQHGLKCRILGQGQPLYTPPDSPLVRSALKITGTRKPTTVPYGTDGVAFAAKMKNLIVLGPGDIAQAHTVDEWISLDQLHRGVEVYSRFIDHICVQGAA